MKTQGNIEAAARLKAESIVNTALKQQGNCSREDWLNQLDRIHGSKSGCAPRKTNSAGVLTKVI